MTTNTIEQLQQQIEQLIRAHLDAQRSATTAAVERAFSAAKAPKRPTRASAPAARARATYRRRASAEVGELADRLYAVVVAHPGATMSVLAPEVGLSARALNRPMLNLKASGRVKSAGQRHLTRYFPME